MSKGDRPRPYSVDLKTFDNNWDAIFKKKDSESEKGKNNSNKPEKSNTDSKDNK